MAGPIKRQCPINVITGLGYSVVLGRDFLEQNRVIIDLGAQTVEFFGHNVIPFLDRKGPSTPLPVHCGQTHVIDARSEALILATASSNVVGLIEPGEKLPDRYHLAGAASLVCPNVQGSIYLFDC